MRYHALACDYDGTLAQDGVVDERTLSALERVRASGRRLLLVTGREMLDLRRVFSRFELFDRVVAENGALLYRPETRDEKPLAEPPPPDFVRELRAAGITPLSVGRSVVATWTPHEQAVLHVIRRLGLELHVVFNKGAVMVLPSGVNKATGLAAALDELGLSPHDVVGVGDAENDHAFLSECECSVAVANALPALKERADHVTAKDHGAGVVELIDGLLQSDLVELEPRLRRHDLAVGIREGGEPVRLPPYGVNVLLAGTSGSGKSTFATSVLEKLQESRRQFCIIDPEGDYPALDGAVVLGDRQRVPGVDEVLDLLASPAANAVVNLLGVSLDERPGLFETLFPRLQELRSRTGRPHWIIVDETHHLLPASWNAAAQLVPQELHGMMLITVHPDHVLDAVLQAVDVIVVVGPGAQETIATFSRTLGQDPPPVPPDRLGAGEAIAWWRRSGEPPFRFRSIPPQAERLRHVRKYAEGELGPDRSFYFKGPESKLNLRAQNLSTFLQIADGVDDETWMHHLRRGDYSRWLQEAIKDEELAGAIAAVERAPDESADATRRRIRLLIEERYTAPA